MTKIFAGLFFFILSFSINIGGLNICLTPPFIGWILIASGLGDLALSIPMMRHAVSAARVLAVYDLFLFVINSLWAGQFFSDVHAWFVTAGEVCGIYIFYVIAEGLIWYEQEKGIFLNAKSLRRWWKTLAMWNIPSALFLSFADRLWAVQQMPEEMQGIYLVLCMAPVLLYGVGTMIVHIGYLCAVSNTRRLYRAPDAARQ